MTRRRAVLLAGPMVLLAGCGSVAPLQGVEEIQREERLADIGVRVHINAPAVMDRDKPSRLLVYALPNGNTIEQTLGARMREGLDGRFDIQHIAAQARLLRALRRARENLFLVLVEAQGLSWPAWRARTEGANAKIASLFARLGSELGAARVELLAHSGGGSFIHGLVEAGPIPESVERISYLDANYSFDAGLHGERFLTWLKVVPKARLIVLAYDDRRIMLGGKLVVSETGGTWRATQRMIDFFGPRVPLVISEDEIWLRAVAVDRRLVFVRHKNLEDRILHTRLVGEMNGLLMVSTLGTSDEFSWGRFGGPRAYGEWVRD